MMWPLGHPGFRQIGRYADGSLGAEDRERVCAHLEVCAGCRRQLVFIRRVGETARTISPPRPPGDALRSILDRRSSGERIILPARPVHLGGTRVSGGRLILAAIAGLLLAAVLVGPPEAGAGASDLRLDPAAPGPGEAVTVTYLPGSLLAGEPHVTLRARFRPDEEFPGGQAGESRTVGRLRRSADGSYEGSFVFPATAAYATLAVEDSAGERVDANGGRLWEVLAHDGAGHPTLAALAQRAAHAFGRDPELGGLTALRMTELYPERPQGWQTLWLFESRAVAGPAAEAVRERHRGRYAQLERALAGMDRLEAADLASLHFYGMMLGEPTAPEWGSRLVAEFPLHPTAVQLAAVAIADRASSDLAGARRDLERLWSRAGPVSPTAAQAGLALAARAADAAAVRQWADRWARLVPDAARQIAATLARDPATRPDAVALLERRVRRVRAAEESARPLPRSVAEHRRASSTEARELELGLAELRLADGDSAGAARLLERIATEGWEPAAFRALAELALASGDTLGALRPLAAVAADPSTGPADSASAAGRLGRLGSGPAWGDAVAAARAEMARRLRPGAIRRPIDGPAPVLDAAGEPRDLAALARGRVTLVAFWHPAAGLLDRATLDGLLRAARSRGALAFGVVSAAPPAATPSPPDAAAPAQSDLYYDPAGVAGRAFRSWGTPWFSVLDGGGRIRFETTRLDEVLRLVAVVLEVPEAVVARGG